MNLYLTHVPMFSQDQCFTFSVQEARFPFRRFQVPQVAGGFFLAAVLLRRSGIWLEQSGSVPRSLAGAIGGE